MSPAWELSSCSGQVERFVLSGPAKVESQFGPETALSSLSPPLSVLFWDDYYCKGVRTASPDPSSDILAR